MKAACFTVATTDFYPRQNRSYAGGNSLNQAIRFQASGWESAFVGALGTDEAGDRVTALLAANAVDISHLYRVEGRTAHNQIVNDEAGERFGVEGTWDGGVYEGFRLSEADWDFLGQFDVWSTHVNDPNFEATLARKREPVLLAVDFLHLTDYALVRRSLAAVDIAFFGGTPEMEAELAGIAQSHPGILVLTLGAEGSLAFCGSRVFRQEALPVEKVVDTTGCGDAFQAAFTASYRRLGDIAGALLAGAGAGREAAQSFGGIPWGTA